MLAGELGHDKRNPVCVFAYVGRAGACLIEEKGIASVNSINKKGNTHSSPKNCPDVNYEVNNTGRSSKEEEFERYASIQRLTLNPLEKRGYWRRNNIMNKQCQTSVIAKIEDKKARILLDSGADVSIIDSSFACELELTIDHNQRLDCVGVGENPFKIDGRAEVKVTLGNELVYYVKAGSEIWGKNTKQSWVQILCIRQEFALT